MDHQNRHNGLLTMFEHWGWLFSIIVVWLGSQVFTFFTQLNGAMWIWFFAASFALMIVGGGLIGYAKFPVYRRGQFFTFGIKSVPTQLAGFYRRGWWVFLFGVTLSLCLRLSKP